MNSMVHYSRSVGDIVKADQVLATEEKDYGIVDVGIG